MRTIEKTVYQFDELSAPARERALAKFRAWEFQDTHRSEYTEEDFRTIAGILGIDIDNVYWSGFWSQCDGASFTGRYRYKAGSAGAIRAHAPQDTELHRIADTLQDAQRRAFYAISTEISHSGRYSHERNMRFESNNVYSDNRLPDGPVEAVAEAMRDLARWLYRQLESAYEWATSDETLSENIRLNEYEFDENGELV